MTAFFKYFGILTQADSEMSSNIKKILYTVLFSLLIFCSACSIDSKPDKFRFIVWGDTQFHNPNVFRKTVLQTELLKPDFVIHVGDIIHGYTYNPKIAKRQWEAFKNNISPLTVPFYPTPGNHDVTTAEIEPVYGEIWGNDRYYYSFDHGNSHFIVLDVYMNQQFDTIPEDEMLWLKSDLEKNRNKDNIFISLHSPLHLNRNYNWEPVQRLLSEYPVKAIFTGHYHIYDYCQKDSIDYFCLNSSGNMVYYNHLSGYSHHYLLVTVDGNDVEYAVFERDGIYPRDVVPSGEYTYAKNYLEKEKTIIIPDPSERSLKTKLEIPLFNRSDTTCNYRLVWESDYPEWKIEPWIAHCSLSSGEQRVLRYRINASKNSYNRESLPKLKVSTSYLNSQGRETGFYYYYRLFIPPTTEADPLMESLNTDGILDESCWSLTTGISSLETDTRGTPAEEENSIKILYDRDYIYIGVKGEEVNPSGLSASAYGDLPLVFGDDDFEIFLDTNRDLKTFYRLMVNPKGTVLCSGPDGLFSFSFDVKTYTGEDFWSAEFKIPFEQIKAEPPRKGDEWGFNFRRHRQQAEPAQRDWSKMRNFPYQPQYFGILIFN